MTEMTYDAEADAVYIAVGHGKIDRTEFRADAQAFFETLDKNKDGAVDGFEVSDYEHDIVPEILGAYRSLDVGGDGERRHRPSGGERRRRGGRKGDPDSLVGADVMGGRDAPVATPKSKGVPAAIGPRAIASKPRASAGIASWSRIRAPASGITG